MSRWYWLHCQSLYFVNSCIHLPAYCFPSRNRRGQGPRPPYTILPVSSYPRPPAHCFLSRNRRGQGPRPSILSLLLVATPAFLQTVLCSNKVQAETKVQGPLSFPPGVGQNTYLPVCCTLPHLQTVVIP